jgi:hypothetical protein
MPTGRMSCLKLGDRQHRVVDRALVARDDALQRAHQMRACEQRVATGMWHRCVARHAFEPEPGARCHHWAGTEAELPGVHAEHGVHRKALEQPTLDHHPRTGLADSVSYTDILHDTNTEKETCKPQCKVWAGDAAILLNNAYKKTSEKVINDSTNRP